MTVTVRINIETASGRKILRELEKHRKVVEIEYPEIGALAGEQTYTIDEVFDGLIDKLGNHYNVDGRKVWNSIK